jgi:TrmH family RNA methyltransferase
MRQAEKRITSRSNELLQRARAVRDGRNRNSIFIEGVRLCEEAFRSPLEIETAFVADGVSERGRALISNLNAPCVSVSDEAFGSLSDTEVHQGLALLARTPHTGAAQFLPGKPETSPLFLALHRINNPSNAGALLRTAEAVGATGVIATAGTTYLFAPKALRGSMGAAFRLPLWVGASLAEVAQKLRQDGVTVICADARARPNHTEINWTAPCALLVGAEAHGLSEAERTLTDAQIRIPMRPQVESLNVAVAAGIILYEAARQRGFA